METGDPAGSSISRGPRYARTDDVDRATAPRCVCYEMQLLWGVTAIRSTCLVVGGPGREATSHERPVRLNGHRRGTVS